jgi:hypothetical protein
MHADQQGAKTTAALWWMEACDEAFRVTARGWTGAIRSCRQAGRHFFNIMDQGMLKYVDRAS